MNARTFAFPVLGAVLFLAGCATTPPPQVHGPAPAACTDSLYVQLAREHPDSLSERAWLRLQSLDSACARARAQTAGDTQGMGMMGMGMMGMGHGRGGAWAILAPIAVVGMVVMMIAIRI